MRIADQSFKNADAMAEQMYRADVQNRAGQIMMDALGRGSNGAYDFRYSSLNRTSPDVLKTPTTE